MTAIAESGSVHSSDLLLGGGSRGQADDDLSSSVPSTRAAYEIAKRVMDLFLAVALLVVLAVPIGIAALCLRLSSPDPIFFVHTRCGRGTTLFRCWKLRTMIADADDFLVRRPDLREAFEANWKITGDPRVTRVGAFLRKTSLDEVPQLWNVLRGEMSIVGPRPIVPGELFKYGDQASALLSIRPGLTGLWQVYGRSRISYDERVRLDLLYVRSQSALLDLRILARTPFVVLSGKGAV